MKPMPRTQKIKNAVLIILILLGIFFAAFSNTALAQEGDTTASGGDKVTLGDVTAEAVLHAINAILQTLVFVFTYLVAWAGALFGFTLKMARAGFGDLDVVIIGWGITRDVANMFFIFILLIIAIATILRIETHR